VAVKFPTDEWIKAFRDQLNSSEAYAKSAKDWEGDFIFVIEGDKVYPNTSYFFVGLLHGKCTDAAMVSSAEERPAQYILSGPYSTWRKVMEGTQDPIQAMMTRKLKLKGNLMKVMRYPKAAKDMVDSVKRVDSEFPA
jgi:putative sterol carrier protein